MFGRTFGNFSIDLNPANGGGSYSGGDALTGRISFELREEVKINRVAVALRGRAGVFWAGVGSKKTHHSAKLDVFKFKVVVMPQDTAGPTKLLPGTHVYPFTFQLPHGDFPSSFHGLHGKIVYTLTVAIDRPWHMSKEFVTEFNFVNPHCANQTELMSPLAGSNSMTLCCLWCSSGPISMDVRLERKAFLPGELVTIFCEFSNNSFRTTTPKAQLFQKQAFFTHGREYHRRQQKLLTSGAGPPIRGHTSKATSEITLTIPADTAFTISNCNLIGVDYIIVVSLCVSGSPDLEVLFPIIITALPGRIAPPPHL